MDIVEKIREIWAATKKKRKETLAQHIQNDADNIFQIKEYKGKLWFVYSQHLVCPIDMLKNDIVDALAKIRALYVERKKEEFS